MNEEIKKELKESILRLKSFRIGSGWTLGTKKTADVLKELIKSVVSIQKILTEQDK